ncbi:MerR family transcriptional regulator [Marinobacter santoriniensis NKSG1]|uniref:MerR family transcriptional regulator n=1 Tax=Marinobacter santoriniensis NKSG1 TaxID=1288826 RepID=M7CMH9_9GAMM|nr:choice-of-anchor I family protein [Marinobacter santoriniensis]EMP54374.1 MerR family transcriptional regulator [Marinobacter santoriniensis NKSG1]
MTLDTLYRALGLTLPLTFMTLAGCVTDGEDGDAGLDGVDSSSQTIELTRVGRSASLGFDTSAAEIVAFDPTQEQIFTTSGADEVVNVFYASDVTAINQPDLRLSIPDLLVANGKVNTATDLGSVTSVSTNERYAAVVIQANPKTDNGWLVFINLSDLTYAGAVQVGAGPDMVTFTPDGKQALVANEGEPDEGFINDPEGTVSIVDASDFSVTNVGFTDYNEGAARYSELPTTRMIIDGYNASTTSNNPSVAQSFEPEYIAVSDDGLYAYVSLQENNAVAVIDLDGMSVETVYGLGFKDHSIPGNELDASQKDGVNIRNWPVKGMYMPDSVAAMSYNGKTYLLTANEGDDRQDWLDGVTDQASCENAGYFFDAGDGCVDAFSAKDYYSADNVTLDSSRTSALNGGFGDDDELRRLKFSYFTTTRMNGGTDFTTLYAYGARSFSIWDMSTGEQVFDSGSDFERITAARYGENFNNDNAENTGDDRSDNKGPEPEAITVGKINGHTYAFIGLERMGGVMVYDVSNPQSPRFVQYINNREVNPAIQPAGDSTSYSPDVGDLGPEGFKFVEASHSPSGKPLLIVGNEVSGNTSIYEIATTLLEE